MPIFFLGLLLGALVGAGVAVACWLGVAAIVLIDD